MSDERRFNAAYRVRSKPTTWFAFVVKARTLWDAFEKASDKIRRSNDPATVTHFRLSRLGDD